MITTETIAGLLRQAEPAVSVYCPLQPNRPDQRAADVPLRELIDAAAGMLAADGCDTARRDALLAPLRRAHDGLDTAAHRDPALALFTDGAQVTVEPLPVEVPAFVAVGRDFHITPLLPILEANRYVYLLALSKTNVRLMVVTPFACRDVPLEYLPPEAQAELDSVAAGRPAEETARQRQVLLAESPARIAAAVRAATGSDGAPIVLAGDPRVLGHFRQQGVLPNVLPDLIAINPFGVPDSVLQAEAAKRVAPLLSAEWDGVLEQANVRLGAADPGVALRLEEILHAAREGRIDRLTVASDATLWGRFAPDQVVSAHGHRSAGDEDLLNLAAVMALRTGARANAMPRERLPRRVEACALLRF